MEAAAIAIGVAANVAGLALLHLAWARKLGGRGVLIGAGWGLVAASLALWFWAGGESGIGHAVAVFCALAAGYALFIMVRAGVRAPAPVQKAKADDAEARLPHEHRAWVVGLHVVVVTLVTALVCGLVYAVLARMGAFAPDALVSAGVLAPLLWAGLTCWLLMDPHSLRRVLGLLVLAALGAAALVVR